MLLTKNATDGGKEAKDDGPTDMEQVVKYHNKLGVLLQVNNVSRVCYIFGQFNRS